MLLRISLLAGASVVFVSLLFSAAQTQNTPQLNLSRDAILGYLNAVITWYRDSTSKIQPVGLPSDAIYQDNARNIASQAVHQAFDSARAMAPLLGNGPEANHKSGQTGPQDLRQMEREVAARVAGVQSQLDAINKQLAKASRSRQKALLAQRERWQGELSLYKTLQDPLDKLADFVEGTNEGGEGLQGSINQLARSVPEILGEPTVSKQTPKPATPESAPATSSGLIGQALTLMERFRSMHDIDQTLKETDRVRQTAENLRKSLRDALAATIQRGREVANQTNAPATAQASDTAQNFQQLASQVKQLSSATIPLSKEIVLFEQARANFVEWRKSILLESTYVLRSLALRIIGIALALGMVLILSDVWRRLTFRYVQEARLRRQFLLLRRFAVGFLIGIVLIVGFVNEFSSLATFAGFLTAGTAVALQAVLLSIAAYFFAVGRYGIRAGDRISIAGVTGDVIDIGLVRLYIMELAGTGIDLYPTGRVIVFANSVLFQAGTPLFKQIPGTEYTLHELAVSLAPGSNYKIVQEELSKAVNTVYEQYREDFERQLGGLEHTEIQLQAPSPESKLQLTDAGLEFVVRYPVDIRRVSEIDDHVTRAVLELMNSDAELKSAIIGSPKVRAPIKG
jgi:small-conductance mechanosensitive channel